MKKLQDPRVIRTKTMLQQALLELLQHTPLKQIKISHLTVQATVSRVTFYQHYRDISHMVDDMIQDMLGKVNLILRYAKHQPNLKVIEELLQHIEQHTVFYRYFLVQHPALHFRARFLQLIVQHLENTRENSYALQCGIQKEVLIWRDASALVGTVEVWLTHDCPYSASFLAKQFHLMHHLEKQTS